MLIREQIAAAEPEIRRMMAEGMKATEMATALGFNYTTFGIYRRQLGIVLPNGRHRGERHGHWKGGKSVEKRSGYVRVGVDEEGRQRYIYEHVLIAERMLGRRMREGEVVHHLNCDPADNRPENLRIVSRSEHAKLHRQLEHIGREMLRRGHVKITEHGYELTL